MIAVVGGGTQQTAREDGRVGGSAYPCAGFPSRGASGRDKSAELPARQSLGAGGETETCWLYVEFEASVLKALQTRRRRGGHEDRLGT